MESLNHLFSCYPYSLPHWISFLHLLCFLKLLEQNYNHVMNTNFAELKPVGCFYTACLSPWTTVSVKQRQQETEMERNLSGSNNFSSNFKLQNSWFLFVSFLFIYLIMENWNVGVRYDALIVTKVLDLKHNCALNRRRSKRHLSIVSGNAGYSAAFMCLIII